MKTSTLAIVLILGIPAAGTAWWQHHHQAELRSEMEALRTLKRGLAEENLERIERMKALRVEVDEARGRWTQSVTELASVRGKVERTHPGSVWSAPPAELPLWDPDSPYVWLRKEILPKLPAPVFNRDGKLDLAAAEVLTLKSGEVTDLNQRLAACLTAYRDLESRNVRRLDEHLPAISSMEGLKVTIQVTADREAGARARSDFESVLVGALGQQRGDIVLQLAENWLDQEFGQRDSDPKTISLVRTPDGGVSISIRSGMSWLSTGLPKEYAGRITNYIPPHLLPFFKDVLD